MSTASRAWLIIEMALLYLLVPLAVRGLVQGIRLPLLYVLATVFAAVVLALTLDRTFSWWETLAVAVPRDQLRQIAVLWAVLGSAIVAFAYFAIPADFLSFPIRRPRLWLLVMTLYPLVSVTAQEIMYRVFFAHRYGRLFRGKPGLAVVVNAAFFAFGHIVFASWLTLAVSFAGGLIFAYRYFSCRSFWAVVLEHGLYGNLIFSVGLARYFLAGIPFA